jgi:adenylate cyclase class 2
MAGKDTETEVKIKVSDLDRIAERIRAAGGTLTSERVHERNVRYDDADGALTPAGRVLRLRQDRDIRLTYKEPRAGDGGMTRTELEVSVSDFEMAHRILGALGYSPAWEYEKYRTTYRLGGCEVVLDETPMGSFIEIEGDVAGIEAALNVLHLQEAQRITESYSVLFEQVKGRLGLSFRDLTFENFRDIAIPAEIFEG